MDEYRKNTENLDASIHDEPFKKASIPLAVVLPIIFFLLAISAGAVYFGLQAQREAGMDSPVISPVVESAEDVVPTIDVNVVEITATTSPTVKPGETATPTPIVIQPSSSPSPSNSPTPTSSWKIMPKITGLVTIAPKPDLIIKEYSFMKSNDYNGGFYYPEKGKQFSAKIWIYNQGQTKSEGFLWEWWATSTKMVCQDWLTGLSPNSGQVVECKYTYVNSGDYQTKAVVDPKNQVSEANESNNTQTQLVHLP